MRSALLLRLVHGMGWWRLQGRLPLVSYYYYYYYYYHYYYYHHHRHHHHPSLLFLLILEDPLRHIMFLVCSFADVHDDVL